MSLLDLLAATEPTGSHTVPDALLGCWRRNWIRFGDQGHLERDVQVIWIQTASGMGDLRLDPRQAPDETDSSCGVTIVDETTRPYVTADWQDGPWGFAQQQVSNFPEKGWLAWDSPSLMRELAPSGAYVEEWERLPGSVGHVAHLRALDAGADATTNLYVVGTYAMLCVRNRMGDGLHEFSWARRSPDAETFVIELSTHPDQVGQPIATDRAWHIESYCDT